MTHHFPTVQNVYQVGLVDFAALMVFTAMALSHVLIEQFMIGLTVILVISAGITVFGMVRRHLYTEPELYSVLVIEVGLALFFGYSSL